MRDDGNLVLSDIATKRNVFWESKLSGRVGERLVMEMNGNLVIYDNQNKTIWETGTRGRGELMRIENDGTFSVYDSNRAKVWSSSKYNHFGFKYFCVRVLSFQTNGPQL